MSPTTHGWGILQRWWNGSVLQHATQLVRRQPLQLSRGVWNQSLSLVSLTRWAIGSTTPRADGIVGWSSLVAHRFKSCPHNFTLCLWRTICLASTSSLSRTVAMRSSLLAKPLQLLSLLLLLLRHQVLLCRWRRLLQRPTLIPHPSNT